MDAGELNMRRETASLVDRSFDLLIVGAGIHGACVARDAAMRGLSVALIDKGDLGGATSHNSLKLIHGGIRYLQHLDVRRVRQSIRERSFWLRCAPHLVRPLRFVIPAYGYGTRSVAALGAARHLYGLLGMGCGADLPGGYDLPAGGTLSRREILRWLPELERHRLNGGVFWTDGQMLDADRVLLECVRSAMAAGAVACNYVRADRFIRDGARIAGVIAEDMYGGGELEIRAAQCVNTAGPWIDGLLSDQFPQAASRRLAGLSKCVNLVTRRVAAHESSETAFGVVSNRKSDSLVDKSSRMFFVTPWRGLSIIGTSHLPFSGQPDELECTPSDVAAFLDEINAAYPFRLTPADVLYCHVGLTPAEAGMANGQVKRARHGEIIDHRRSDEIDGLTSVVGVKYTTARLVAERTVDLILHKLERYRERCMTAFTPLPGIEQTGSDESDRNALENLRDATWLRARSRYAARSEMALHLGDFVFRRSALAETGLASHAALRLCADAMAEELGWSQQRRDSEIDEVVSRLRHASQSGPEHVATTTLEPAVDEQIGLTDGLREGVA